MAGRLATTPSTELVNVPKVVLGRIVAPDEDAIIIRTADGLTLRLARFTDGDLVAIASAREQTLSALMDLDIQDTTLFLAAVGRAWLGSLETARTGVLEHVSRTTELPVEMLAQDYRAIGHALSHRAYVYDLFAVELGDEWAMDEWRRVQASTVRAYPRGIVVHGLVGNTPVAGIASIARGLITRNMNLAKVAARDPLSPMFFAQVCAQVDSEHPLVRGLSIGYWEHSDPVGERATCLGDAVCLWGGDEGIAAMRANARPGAPVLEFGPKRSLAVIDLDAADPEVVAMRLATEVSFYEQEACVSPQRLFLKGDYERLRDPLRRFLDIAAQCAPKVTAEPDAHAHVSFARLEAAYRGWPLTCGRDWTIIEAPDPNDVREHPLGRTLYIHSVGSLDEVAEHLDETVQTVGVFPWHIALPHRDAWARRGIARIVELGLSRHPRKGFSHDGLRALNSLVRFVSVERPIDHYYKYLDEPYAEGAERDLFFHD